MMSQLGHGLSLADRFSIHQNNSIAHRNLKEYTGMLDNGAINGHRVPSSSPEERRVSVTSNREDFSARDSIGDHPAEPHVEKPNETAVKLEPNLPAEVDLSNRQHPSSSDDQLPSSTSQPVGHSLSGFPGNLVIKVVGDSLSHDVSQPDVVNQLSKKLGLKVVLQMENSDGEVVFEDAVTPANQSHSSSTPGDSNPDESYMYPDSKLFPSDGNHVNNGVVEKHEPIIVNTVLNTIRELATRLGRMEQLRDCPICGDTVTGFHYGVQTCESCKGFFKRTVQNKKKFNCLRNKDCEVYLQTRKKCPACRFQKCCEVGMRVEGIREDRSRGGRSTYEGASAFLNRRFKRLSESTDYQSYNNSYNPQKRAKTNETLSPEPPISRKPIIPELLQQILALESHYEEVTTTPQPCCVNRMNAGDKDKFNSMLHITEHRLYQIVKWARHLPNFLNVHTADQVLLLQNAWAELTCLGVIWRSRESEGVIKLSYGKTIDMQKAKEMDHEEVISRMLYVCESFRRLKIDEYEYVTLKVLALMLPDIKGLENCGVIQAYQNNLLDALMIYTTSNYPEYPLKFGELLLRLSEVQRLTAISRQQILHLQSPEVEKNSLLMELLRHQSFGRGAQLTDAEALNVITSNYKNEIITPQYNFCTNSLRLGQRTPGVAVVAPHTSRSEPPLSPTHLPSPDYNEHTPRKLTPHSESSQSKGDCEPLKSTTVDNQHSDRNDYSPPLSTYSIQHARKASADHLLRSPSRRHSILSTEQPSEESIAPQQTSPLDRSMSSSLVRSMGKTMPGSLQSNASIDLSNKHAYGHSPRVSNKQRRKVSEGHSEVSSREHYTPVTAHNSLSTLEHLANRHADYGYPAFEQQHSGLSPFNSQLLSLERLQAAAMPVSEASKHYTEQWMSARITSQQLLAAQRYANMAGFHANIDNMPQDFSMGGNRLAHSYDPGGS